MKFNIELNDEDYIRFNTFLLFHSNSGKKAITMGRCLGLAISLLVMLVLVLAKADNWLIIVEACMLAVFSIVVFVMYPSMAKKKLRKNILKLKEEGELPYVKQSTLEFRDSDIFEEKKDGTRVIPYSDLMCAYDTDDYIYLKKGAQEALVLPKDCLEGRDGELVAFLSGKVNVISEAGEK